MPAFGLTDKTIATIRQILVEFPAVEKAILYGSRAKGNYKQGSDIDLTLVGERLDLNELGKIAGQLDESPIPYQVDLSILDQLNHAGLREHIDRVGVVFYERGSADDYSGAAVSKPKTEVHAETRSSRRTPNPSSSALSAPPREKKSGWQTKTLGKICKTGSGGTPLSSRKEYYDGGTIPWLVSGEVAQGNVREAKNFITKAGLENSAAKLFPKDTVLIAMYGATAGQVGILRFEAATNQAVCGILPNDKFVPEFLFYFFLAKKDDLVAQATGNAQPNISQIKIKNMEVPVPPLAEQQRIVGLLDEAFEGIATAKANAEKNLQNARALFESHLHSVFSQKGEGWVETTLDKISTNHDSKRVPITKNVRSSGEYPYYGAFGIVDYVEDYIFDGDNLLVSEDGANLLARSTPIAFSVSGKYWVNNHAHILHFENMATQRFVEFYLESIKLDEYITGAAQPKLNQKALNSIPIPIPKSVDEQAEIVESVELLHEETRRLAAIYERKLAALEALKKSLLHRAFNGEL